MSKSSQTPTSRPLADYLGISSATLCLIHCLATPVLMLMGVAVHGAHEGHDHSHGWMVLLGHGWDFLFLGIGFLAVLWSTSHTHHLGRKILLWLSFVFLAGAILLEHMGPVFQYLTYLASLVLIFAHASNIKAILSNRNKTFVCMSDDCAAKKVA